MDGQGSFRYPNGSTYKGNYLDGMMDGHGIFLSPNGDKYIG